ncbi:unnamed protein product, partial [Gulo gulo]
FSWIVQSRGPCPVPSNASLTSPHSCLKVRPPQLVEKQMYGLSPQSSRLPVLSVSKDGTGAHSLSQTREQGIKLDVLSVPSNLCSVLSGSQIYLQTPGVLCPQSPIQSPTCAHGHPCFKPPLPPPPVPAPHPLRLCLTACALFALPSTRSSRAPRPSPPCPTPPPHVHTGLHS